MANDEHGVILVGRLHRAVLYREVVASLASRRDRFFARVLQERGLPLLPVVQGYEYAADTHGVLECERSDKCAGAIHFGGVRRDDVEYHQNIHVRLADGFPARAGAIEINAMQAATVQCVQADLQFCEQAADIDVHGNQFHLFEK